MAPLAPSCKLNACVSNASFAYVRPTDLVRQEGGVMIPLEATVDKPRVENSAHGRSAATLANFFSRFHVGNFERVFNCNI